MKKKYLQSLGPSLLFVGAAVGVSHLVQSTRAGAEFGFGLIWALILVCLFKYPFFQFGPRYAAITGETLLDGYRRLGKGFVTAYFVLNIAVMFTIQATVTIVTAGLASQLFGFEKSLDSVDWAVILSVISIVILAIGKYKFLDNLMKYIILVLSISTIIAVFMALSNSKEAFDVRQIIPYGAVELTFLIALLGWMPAPLDVSIWQSIWYIEKEKISPSKEKKHHAIFDFNIGYISTLTLGVCFVLLGAFVMYKSGETFSSDASVFASQFIKLYTKSLGDFSLIFIGIAAFTTMFSTTLTSLDASSRSMNRASKIVFNKKIIIGYWFWILVLFIGTFLILKYFMHNMGTLVKIATILSFLTSPFYAILNFRLMTSKHIKKDEQPSLILKILSVLGIVFLIGFSIWYLSSI